MIPQFKTRLGRGYTLMEMLAAIAVFSAVLSLLIALLALWFRLDDAARRHTDVIATTARLARLWRADVHAALGCETEGPPAQPLIRLSLPGDRVVTYEANPRWMKRTVFSGDRQIAVERFRMHRPGAGLSLSHARGAAIVTLRFDHHGGAGKAGRAHTLRIDARAGADHRYEEEATP